MGAYRSYRSYTICEPRKKHRDGAFIQQRSTGSSHRTDGSLCPTRSHPRLISLIGSISGSGLATRRISSSPRSKNGVRSSGLHGCDGSNIGSCHTAWSSTGGSGKLGVASLLRRRWPSLLQQHHHACARRSASECGRRGWDCPFPTAHSRCPCNREYSTISSPRGA